MPSRPSLPSEFRLRLANRAFVVLVTALALGAVLSLIWISAAHPEPGAVDLLEVPQFGGPVAIRWITAWAMVGACGVLAAIGLWLLAMDFRSGRLRGHRPGRHVGQQ